MWNAFPPYRVGMHHSALARAARQRRALGKESALPEVAFLRSVFGLARTNGTGGTRYADCFANAVRDLATGCLNLIFLILQERDSFWVQTRLPPCPKKRKLERLNSFDVVERTLAMPCKTTHMLEWLRSSITMRTRSHMSSLSVSS